MSAYLRSIFAGLLLIGLCLPVTAGQDNKAANQPAQKETTPAALPKGLYFIITAEEKIYYGSLATVPDDFEIKAESKERTKLIDFDEFKKIISAFSANSEISIFICFDAKIKFRNSTKYLDIIQDAGLSQNTDVAACPQSK